VGVLPRQARPTHRHHFRLTIARPPSVRVCPAAAHNTCLSSFMGCACSGLPSWAVPAENRYRRLSSLCAYASGSAGRVSGCPGLCTAAGGRLALDARGFSGKPLDGILLAPLAEPGRAVAAEVRAYGGVRRPAYGITAVMPQLHSERTAAQSALCSCALCAAVRFRRNRRRVANTARRKEAAQTKWAHHHHNDIHTDTHGRL
jgi:hypothetical protein